MSRGDIIIITAFLWPLFVIPSILIDMNYTVLILLMIPQALIGLRIDVVDSYNDDMKRAAEQMKADNKRLGIHD